MYSFLIKKKICIYRSTSKIFAFPKWKMVSPIDCVASGARLKDEIESS